MTGRRVRLLFGGAAMAALLPVLSACHVGPHPKSGAGEALDVCSGLKTYNTLGEPVLADRKSVLTYLDAVHRVFGRIDTKNNYTDLNGKKQPAPVTVVGNLGVVGTAYDSLHHQLAATVEPSLVKAAVVNFTASPSFNSADTALELWANNNCG
jgi:hypothetical protein